MSLQRRLLAWGGSEFRDLPWRRTRDPWAILVSEVMLQQTQVPRVVPRYQAFLERFPTVDSCATAPKADVVRLWAGLGYNRRAVNLHSAAIEIVESHGGRFPDDLSQLLALPGVGEYTARAVLAFAFEHDVGVLDTNVARVVARTVGRRLTRSEAQVLADVRVPSGRAWAWNQAVLDLGAQLCTSTAPACERCPITGDCAWFASGRPEPDPAVGSAGVSGRQSRFAGSDRQGRGRLVDALRHGAVPVGALPEVMGWPDDAERAERVASQVVGDGLAQRRPGCYELA